MVFRLGDCEKGEEEERLKDDTPDRDLVTRLLWAAVYVNGMIEPQDCKETREEVSYRMKEESQSVSNLLRRSTIRNTYLACGSQGERCE